MTRAEHDSKTAVRICNGNLEALDWMQIGRLYCHAIDDLVDIDLPVGNKIIGAECACRIGAMALELYTHPFFIKNMGPLKLAMLQNTGNYMESVRWEQSSVAWQRGFSDWARHGWVEILLAIAQICGGFEHRMSVAEELRTVSYFDHHDDTGKHT